MASIYLHKNCLCYSSGLGTEKKKNPTSVLSSVLLIKYILSYTQ